MDRQELRNVAQLGISMIALFILLHLGSDEIENICFNEESLFE